MTDNSVERRIYDRQVNKQGMADRVVDEQNPDNHLHTKDLNGVIVDDESDPIYTLEPETVSREARESYADDSVLQKVLEKCYRLFTKLPFAHESLLVDRKEKRLTRAEKRYESMKFDSRFWSKWAKYIPNFQRLDFRHAGVRKINSLQVGREELPARTHRKGAIIPRCVAHEGPTAAVFPAAAPLTSLQPRQRRRG